MSTARTLREAFDVRFAPLGLNLTQAMVLAYVHEFGPITQTKIADHLRVGRAIVGAIIDRLQERQLLERRPDPVDRRVWQVGLTAVGRRSSRANRQDRRSVARSNCETAFPERNDMPWLR